VCCDNCPHPEQCEADERCVIGAAYRVSKAEGQALEDAILIGHYQDALDAEDG
jgi:hypothetical protein